MQHSMDDDLDQLLHVFVTCDDIWDPTVLDHSIDIENDIYHPSIDSSVDDEDFMSVDDCTSTTGSNLNNDDDAPKISVMSTTMNRSPTWDLISILPIIPIVFLHNI